jgi:uncharacterized membrane protein
MSARRHVNRTGTLPASDVTSGQGPKCPLERTFVVGMESVLLQHEIVTGVGNRFRWCNSYALAQTGGRMNTVITKNTADSQKIESAKNLATICYALYGASFLVGITPIIAIVINYVKLDDAAGTWLESHFRWQIRTFWFSLLWAVIGVVTSFVLIGFAILFADLIWFIYRIVKGFLALNDNKPIGIESSPNAAA